ncbi:MAG: hypothetical protein JWN30_2135 [Bacilli bacterium]|nr:hypothetical protein [Bacilli bacterium]
MDFLIILVDVEFTEGEENCRRVLLNEFASSSLNWVL